MKLKLICSAIAWAVIAAAPARAEAPRVVASIAPIHSLVASVMEGVGEPELLIPAEVTEHDYALKPSDIRKLAGADLVVWVGESLESYLVKPLATEEVESLELLNVPGIDAHRFGSEESAHTEEETHADHATDEHRHDHLGLDPHVWLDPVRAAVMVRAVAQKLVDLDPGHGDIYEANAARAVDALAALDGEIRALLAPHADKPFVTFHDGYSYFVQRYGLRQVGQLAVHPEQRPGVASVRELRAAMTRAGVGCAFAEPQFDPGALGALTGNATIKVGTLDTLGAGLPTGPELYAALLRRNAEAIATCLAATS